ncbi:GLPGLI family protein [Polaribacter tangerinus]|uniref:GLPGLI family protein n=1 Tax=Polaribacter tangerinus TaxID=1920034 RepID=UPI000B4AF0E3|nr:GLPGLI family protein [Polaribacter tangerinus]
MIKKIFIIKILFFSTIINSQTNLLVKYTEVISLGAPSVNLKTYNASLFVSNDFGLYVTKIDSLENGGKTITKTYKDKNGKLFGIRDFSSKDGLYQITNRSNDTLYSNARFNNKFMYKEVVPKIDWEITNEIKKIEGIEVQKAKALFRGRYYIAWFTKEIPVALGPWKLNGLPGLIIEAYDSNNEVLFLFKKIEYPYKKTFITPNLKREWYNYEEFIKEKENQIQRNLKYSRAIGQHLDSKGSETAIIKLRKKSFIEYVD